VSPIRRIQQEQGIVGREAELRLSLAVLAAGRNLLLEGPVGVGKTTVALAVCRHLGRRAVRVDGDERFTESRMTGWFDPPLVLKRGYAEESFFPGPLVQAMREGSVLFINEMNRMPETVQNVLLPALDERLLVLPRLGELRAAEGFQVVATQNPVEYIATGHLSEALRDRFEHVALRYQDEPEERAIVARDTGAPDEELIGLAVAIVRMTRTHEKVRKGASVRAAAGIVKLALALAGGDDGHRGEDPTCDAVLREAALTALATRIELKDEEETDLATVIADIVDSVKKKG
jgi:gas vesicle protein GvpN